MADVYAATCQNAAGAQELVALKRIRRELSEDPAFLRMFLDEARITRYLDHPNIARLIDVGGEADSTYLVMEYVPGLNVKALLAEGPLPPHLAVQIALAVAEGLHSAHEKADERGQPLNIVHRDVTPMNVMVTFDGEVKLLDFGIAVARGRAEKTQAGFIKGKWSYLSPEQVVGKAVDRRADVFTLGSLLYEMLTGTRAFPGEAPVAVLRAVASEEPRPLAEQVEGLPAELVSIVARCLRKRLGERFQTAAQVAEELRALSGVWTLFSGGKRLETLAEWIRRHHADRYRSSRAMVETLTARPTDSSETVPASAATPPPAPFEELASDVPSSSAPEDRARTSPPARPTARETAGAAIEQASEPAPLDDSEEPEVEGWNWPLLIAIGLGLIFGGIVAVLWFLHGG